MVNHKLRAVGVVSLLAATLFGGATTSAEARSQLSPTVESGAGGQDRHAPSLSHGPL